MEVRIKANFLYSAMIFLAYLREREQAGYAKNSIATVFTMQEEAFPLAVHIF